MQEAYSSLIIIYKATLVRIANKCFLHDRRVRRENRKYASSYTIVVRIATVLIKYINILRCNNHQHLTVIIDDTVMLAWVMLILMFTNADGLGPIPYMTLYTG